MNDLIEFLRARYDEAEAAAKAAQDVLPSPWTAHESDKVAGLGDLAGADGFHEIYTCHTCEHSGARTAVVEHIARHDPAKVLRDIVAKRQILDEVMSLDHNTDSDSWFDCPKATHLDREGQRVVSSRANEPCNCEVTGKQEKIFRLLALPYDDHPDYREEWKP